MARYTLTVQNVEQLEQYWTITFNKPQDLVYEDGQYGVFLFVDKPVEGRKMRAFSFASSNQENELVIATKVSNQPSSFKQQIATLKPGDQMTVDGPMGRMTINPNKEKVFIAGGIGITPIRGMLRGLDSYESVNLVYSEANETYPFLNDLEAMTGLKIDLTSGKVRTTFLIEQQTHLHDNKAVYYVSGSPSFVNGIMAKLKELGISENNIKFDRFTGY